MALLTPNPRGATNGACPGDGARKAGGRRRRWQIVASSLLCTLALLVHGPAGQGADPAPVPSTAPASPASTAIPVTEVATRAAEVPGLLRALTEPLAPSAEIEAIRKGLPALHQEIGEALGAGAVILQAEPTLNTLQAQQQAWQRRQVQTTTWLNVLTRRATYLQEALNHLDQIRGTWRQTREVAVASKAPGPILLEIDGALAAIDGAGRPLEAQRIAVLDLQSGVAQEVARAGTALAEFTQAQQRAMGGILTRDSPPIWNPKVWAEARAKAAPRIRSVIAARWEEVARYVSDPSQHMPWHVGMVAVLAVALAAAGRRARQWTTTAENVSAATAVLDHPLAATMVVVLILVASPYSPLPLLLRVLLAVVGLAPVIRLTRPLADPRIVPAFYALGVLFAVDRAREVVANAPVIEQVILALEMIAGIAWLRYSLGIGGLRRSPGRREETGRLPVFRVGAGLVMLIFAVALVAGVLGYMRLARLLASGVLFSGVLALMLYAGVQVVAGVAAFALRVWPLSLLQMVHHHRDLLERRIHRVLVYLAIGGWVIRTLNSVGLFEPALSFGDAVLTAKLGRGSIQISVGNILEFVLTVWLAYLLSSFIRFVLREDVYPRTQLTRGISYAISSLLNYVIIALGFVLALGALGMDLSKVTVLAGAFGVGIGFGLQSVVNNFVSGLILLFERPDPRGRHRRGRQSLGRGVPHRHPGQHGAHLAGRRDHRAQRAARDGAGDQLDAVRPDAPHRAARGRGLRQPARAGGGGARGGGARAPGDHADSGAPGRLQGLRRQLDQLRAARLDEPLRALAQDPDRAGRRHIRGAARGGDVPALPPARGAPAARRPARGSAGGIDVSVRGACERRGEGERKWNIYAVMVSSRERPSAARERKGDL